MKEKEVSASLTGHGTASVTVPFPETVEEAVSAWGEEVAYSLLRQEATKRLQSSIRSQLAQGKDQASIQEALASWKPGVGRPKVSKIEKALKLTSGMSDEELRALLAKIKENR